MRGIPGRHYFVLIAAAIVLLSAVILVAFLPRSSSPRPTPAEYPLPTPSGQALETIDPPGFLPPIGKWMISPAGKVANWLGQPADGKEVLEPINVVILDPIATNEGEAEARLVAACTAAGFEVRSGHSSGYGGIIAGFVYPELPRGPGDCFSDKPFILPNNHGRIFGPHRLPGGWLFAGAFSREGIELGRKVPHAYESMNRARDAFVRGMVVSAGYVVASFVDLGNTILGDPARGAGDHDGVAAFIRATR